ncbi:hypothetical protein Skr01_62510 [Sphaerisporangium krabiense]|uniref:Uncharacterized membrane protein YozB (DUF420 family) n=1 Tax=Sphaerisporangium krabiense TaxID=763782 RepID=A0A7W9DP81_9ACTN|nr:DUF2306 domain-containing protein [Sphaerisporangium krabiense]MBB5626167.1 uncharacterized membrane protein YozB (DUF420 family) [Sphaerisporangium krabiense]GII66166.1 hypothetical protein Skr01_62510 [Sphaerisporangium krabiense]
MAISTRAPREHVPDPLLRPSARIPWWRRPWVAPLGFVTVLFLAFSLPPYLTGDPARSRVPVEDFAAHYPLLVAHVLFASVAMITCFLQVWPWFRRRHPAAHRWTGRAYVFAGVLPAGLSGIVIGALTPFGPVLAVSNVMLALLWLGCTAAGYRMARRRRFVEHRRWMLRAFALTFSIITNRIWGVILTLTLSPSLDTLFGGDQQELTRTVAGLGGWLGWTVPLLVVEWWLGRGDAAKRRARARTAA